MTNNVTPDIDQKNLKYAVDMWQSFIKGGMYITALAALILIGLALSFVKFT